MTSLQNEYDELVKRINDADYKYHSLDDPDISDAEYDSLMRRLFTLESEYKNLDTSNSPTKRRGGKVLDKFTKVNHNYPMMSLSNVFNMDEINNFTNSINYPYNYFLELKLDGLSISLIYEKGVLLRGVTRGNGVIGEDVTNNIKTIRDIPLKLNKEIDLEVRGEVFMTYSTFNKLNREIELQNEEIEKENKSLTKPKKLLNLLKNPRNAAAGSIRQLDSKIASKRRLNSFMYQIPNPLDYGLKTQDEVLKFLKNLGFKVNDNYSKIALKSKDIEDFINLVMEKRDALDYPIDGVVIKYNDITKWDLIGLTERYPKYMTAYKFPEEEVVTKLEDFIFTVGRTGKITPNAVLAPVIVGGSTVRRATLHNADYIYKRDLRKGDFVKVKKAAEIIPEVVSPFIERREGIEIPFKMMEECPICTHKLVKKDTEANFFCPNKNCNSRKINSLIHFVSREAMNIEGLGEEIISDFYNLKYLNTFSDIYKLKDHKKELMELEGFGEKSITNLMDSIETSKSSSLEKLIFALGILNVGAKTAKTLAKNYNTLDLLMKSNEESLLNIKDIGPETAKEIIKYFNNEDNKKEIENLRTLGLNFNYLGKTSINNFINNKTFVVTGSLEKYKRHEIEDMISNAGGKASSSVSSKTDYLVVGKDPGSKYQKALELNVPILTEEEFLNYVNKS